MHYGIDHGVLPTKSRGVNVEVRDVAVVRVEVVDSGVVGHGVQRGAGHVRETGGDGVVAWDPQPQSITGGGREEVRNSDFITRARKEFI